MSQKNSRLKQSSMSYIMNKEKKNIHQRALKKPKPVHRGKKDKTDKSLYILSKNKRSYGANKNIWNENIITQVSTIQ